MLRRQNTKELCERNMTVEHHRKPTVLIVDDDAEWVERVKRELQRLECSPLFSVAHDASTAIDVVRESRAGGPRIDLVILDVHLPWQEDDGEVDVEGGVKLLCGPLTGYRLLDPRVPVIVSTAFPEIEDCVACMRAGAVDYVPKFQAAGEFVHLAPPTGCGGPQMTDEEDLIGEAGTAKLARAVKHALFADSHFVPSFEVWLREAHGALCRTYLGKHIAAVPLEIAESCGLGDQYRLLFGRRIVSGDSYDAVRDTIMESIDLWRQKYPIEILLITEDTGVQ
jgi:CheY-like chemotaxis protein